MQVIADHATRVESNKRLKIVPDSTAEQPNIPVKEETLSDIPDLVENRSEKSSQTSVHSLQSTAASATQKSKKKKRNKSSSFVFRESFHVGMFLFCAEIKERLPCHRLPNLPMLNRIRAPIH